MRRARQARRMKVPTPFPKGAEKDEHDFRFGCGRPGVALRRLVAASILVAMVLATPKPARAGRLGPDVIALFPKDIGEFAYADLKKARTLKWFPQLQEQLLPERFRQFEKFLASAGVDPNSQVEELAWALVADGMSGKTDDAAAATAASSVPTGEQVVGVALGNFNPGSTEAYFKQQNCPRSRPAAIACMRLEPARDRTISSSFSSIRTLRRLATAAAGEID